MLKNLGKSGGMKTVKKAALEWANGHLDASKYPGLSVKDLELHCQQLQACSA